MSDDLPVAFRNVTRYVRDVPKSAPLYEALGFKPVRVMEGFAVLEAPGGPKLILHGWDEVAPGGITGTALSFTMKGNDVQAARAHVERAGWKLLREPQAEDEGFFYIYADLDGNPINLVGERRHGG